jgi:hypothetical protein
MDAWWWWDVTWWWDEAWWWCEDNEPGMAPAIGLLLRNHGPSEKFIHRCMREGKIMM